jgi:hypothetical protein
VTGGIRAEWLVTCDDCSLDAEPGRFYDSREEAEAVRERVIRYEAWLLTERGELKCPECAAS